MKPGILLSLSIILGWLGADFARAHDPGLSSADLQLTPSTLELKVVFSPNDLQLLIPIDLRTSPSWTEHASDAGKIRLNALNRAAWKVSVSAEGMIPSKSTSVTFEPGNNLVFHASFPRPSRGRLRFEALLLSELPPGHRQYFSVYSESKELLLEKLLSTREPSFEFDLPETTTEAGASAPRLMTFIGFVRLGIEHILTGYDHLLFLFGLLVVCRRFKTVVGIITCFTLAHSITLALAALEIVTISSRIVEPLIAASIVFVGVENLIRRENPRGRKTLAFLFGLIHGFGFASALRELGLGVNGRDLLVPLFSFNLGVELGQVSVAATVLPLLWWLRKSPVFVPRIMPALSCLVAAAGLYWLLERTVFVF